MSQSATLTLDEFPPNTYEEWRAAAEESLKGAPFEKKLITRTHEGIELQPIYNQSDLDALNLPENWPGLPPYLRGRRPAPDTLEPWLIAQEIPLGNPTEFNRAALHDLMRGQNSLTLLLDSATRRGLNPADAPPIEVGQCGLSVALLSDLETAIEGIHLDAIPILAWCGPSNLALLGAITALTRKRGKDLASLRGAILADPLTDSARWGSLPLSLADAYSEMATAARWAASHAPALRTAGIQASFYANCGANAVEELTFGIATGTEYLRQLIQAGLDPTAAADRILFEFNLGVEIFIHLAKLRAARLLWWRITSVLGAPNAPMFIHARSSLANKSHLDAYNNMLRATAEGFIAAVGGADSFHVAAFDETFRIPDEFSRRIARNTHIILSEECGFTHPVDPAAGSWFIECLTHQLATKAWELFQSIEREGGMAAALRNGTPQKAAQASAEKKRAAIASRRDGLIGVNLFPNPAEKLPDTPPSDPAAAHAARVQALAPALANQPTLNGPLTSIEAIAEAWSSGASLGAITAALPRSGTPDPAIPRLSLFHYAADYEALRANARRWAAEKNNGQLPKIWLATFGPPKQHKARADFSLGFFTPGGFLVESGKWTNDPAEAAELAAAAKPLAVVICSTDETYPQIVPAFVPELRKRLPEARIILAGYPPDQVEAHKAAGVQDFIHIRLSCLDFNRQLQATLGIAPAQPETK